jgi:methylmalonyl-CoA mutase, N-terminal domain
VESGETVVVGVNRFQQEEDGPPVTFRIDPALEGAQVERLRDLRASRSTEEVKLRLDALEQAARGSENLMPRILNACDVYATVGEISDCLRRVFGEHRENS